MDKRYKIWRTETALWEKLRPIAREMRCKPTEAENILSARQLETRSGNRTN